MTPENGNLVFEFAAGTKVLMGGTSIGARLTLLRSCPMEVTGVHTKQELREMLLGNDRQAYRINRINLSEQSYE